jgi:uncharacterized Ntn-hydrolase superfamily protein
VTSPDGYVNLRTGRGVDRKVIEKIFSFWLGKLGMKTKFIGFVLSVVCSANVLATYSILGFDPETGEIGGAVQSCVPTVTMVLHGRGDVGMLAVQGRPRPEYGDEGLSFLRTGMAPREVIEAVHRGGFIFTPWGGNKFEMQFSVMDRKGQTAGYTGPQCQEYAGHLQGRYCIAQGNLVANSRVVSAMVRAFEATSGTLKYRLMAALEAAQANGGDRRGMMSAAMVIVKNGVRENDGKVLELESNINFSPLRDLRNKLSGEHEGQAERKLRLPKPK